MNSTTPNNSDHSCGLALQTSWTNRPKTFWDSWCRRSVFPISQGLNGPLNFCLRPSKAQNSRISVLRNSWPLSDLTIFGMVRLRNRSFENALRTSGWERALQGSSITALEMQHT